MKLALGTIVYRDINIHHHLSMVELARQVGGPLAQTIIGDTLVSRARSELASWFLRTEADVLLSIDSDIQFEPADALKVAELANRQESVVAASYATRNTVRPAHLLIDVHKTEDGLRCAEFLPAGFMAVHRRVFEKLQPTLPHCQSNADSSQVFHPYYMPMVYEGLYLSEDWAFCQRARDAGFHCWLDPSVRLVHWGEQGFTLPE